MSCDCDYIVAKGHWDPHYQNCSTIYNKKYGTPSPKNRDGTFNLTNKNLEKLDVDVLYYLRLDNKNYDLPKLFGDVKFVCMCYSISEMNEFAHYVFKRGLNIPRRNAFEVGLTMNKVGPIIFVNHGLQIPSSALLQEVIKLLSYAKAKDPILFRIGRSSGLGVPPGSVVISSCAISGTLEKTYDVPVLGKMRKLPSLFDNRLSEELLHIVSEEKKFKTFIGGTIGADNFIRGQGRTNGLFYNSTEDKISFFNKLVEMDVKNIGWEAAAFAAITGVAGLRSANISVTIDDRLKKDQNIQEDQLLKWDKRPMLVVTEYISKFFERQTKLNSKNMIVPVVYSARPYRLKLLENSTTYSRKRDFKMTFTNIFTKANNFF